MFSGGVPKCRPGINDSPGSRGGAPREHKDICRKAFRLLTKQVR